MDKPTPDETPVPDPKKPAPHSVGTALVAALLLIPGLCFSFGKQLGALSIVLAVLWVVLLIVGLVAGLVAVVRALMK